MGSEMCIRDRPEGSRLIVRRERPHPGAQLRFTDADGHRFTAFLDRGFVERDVRRVMVLGDQLRDWGFSAEVEALFPYNADFRPIHVEQWSMLLHAMWPWETNLANSLMFGRTSKIQAGLRWTEFGRLTHDKLLTPLSVTFAFVATHNHFVLDRGGKVFKQSAPVIKLPAGASEDDHLRLLGLLNSSTACFWLKQVSQNKGNGGIGGGIGDEDSDLLK